MRCDRCQRFARVEDLDDLGLCPDCLRKLDDRFLCLDCGKYTKGGEYYMVRNELWAASGLGPHDGMLCLLDLERRIGRPLTLDDFAGLAPSLECWEHHVAARRR